MIKKIKPLAWLFVLSFTVNFSQSGFAHVEVIKKQGQTIMNFSLDEISIKEVNIQNQSFTRIDLKGADEYLGVSGKTGTPQIPVIRFNAPSGMVVVKPELEISGELVNLPQIAPVQMPQLKVPNVISSLAFDSVEYQRNSLEPNEMFEVKEDGSIRGVAQSLVTIYPFAYSPKSGKYRLIKKFTVMISYSEQAQTSPKPETIAFIVGEKFRSSPSLVTYQEHKNSLGYNTTVLYVTAKDTPETIRQRIKEIYKGTNLTYAIIIGDAQDVPGKPSNIIEGVTDHYYRAIDTDNYEMDINGPDIGLGRISVANENQLATVLTKMQRYEAGEFSDEKWLKAISWIATNDRWELAEGTHNYVIDAYTKSTGYLGTFPGSNQIGGDQLYAITHRADNASTIRTIGMGRTIINYSGHGSETSWSGPNVSQRDVQSLKDENALPFVISNACVTGKFTIPESFAETWQRHPMGAIAFWGSMDSTYWDEDDILERRLFDGIFQKGYRTFAAITDQAQSELWRHYGGNKMSKYYRETYVLFGDPSILLRINMIKDAEVTMPSKIPMGTPEIQITVKAAGKPLPGLRVALSTTSRPTSHQNIITGTSNSEGTVIIDTKELSVSPGIVRVTITGPDLKILRKQFEIVR